jgi:ubiquinone/menaquinone biosynthesis C-methylase UbiE
MLHKKSILSSGRMMNSAVNYNKFIFDKFSSYIYGNVLEFGAGTGNFSLMIKNKCEYLDIIDEKDKSISFLRERLKFEKNINITQSDIENIRKVKKKFDAIVLLNVLEHIKEDDSAIETLLSLLNSDGTLIIQVPSFNFLYSDFDRSVGHYRRYKKKDFLLKSNNLNFHIEEMYYFNPVGAIGWWFNYCLLKKIEIGKKSTSEFQIKFYDKYIMPFVKFFDTKKNFFGVSLFVIIKKKKFVNTI